MRRAIGDDARAGNVDRGSNAMKLVIAVVQGKDAEPLLKGLTSHGYRATQINSAGGFLRESNVTLLIGVDEADVDNIRALVRENCHSRTRFVNPLMPIADMGEFYSANPVEVLVGGATMFVVSVSRYERIGV
jgi:uncharacterized protein YaaQ